MTEMAAATKAKSRFLEGGNGIAVIAIPVLFILCVVFYRKVGAFFSDFNIKIEDVYLYVFSIFAIEYGALLALFALFTCRPTPFLERIKNTQTFASILMTTKITMAVATVVIAVTFIFGIIRLEPERALTLHSILFLAWVALAAATTCFYARTIRLIFAALA
jgi:hypothetical protein